MAEIKLHTKFYAGEDIINAILAHMDTVAALPAADVVEVVRCKDCKYSYDSFNGWCCSHSVCAGWIMPGDFYCKCGERKEGQR